MPAVESLCTKAGVTPAMLSGIGVSIGPGGFTGLRIGIAASKMLAWSLGVPVIAVPTALVAAESDTEPAPPMAVALSGKDDTCWLSIVEGEPGQRVLASGQAGGQLVDAAGFQAAIAGATCLLADDHLPASMAGHGLDTRAPDFRPESLLEITERGLAGNQAVDPLHLAPIYPREPEAVRLWDAREG